MPVIIREMQEIISETLSRKVSFLLSKMKLDQQLQHDVKRTVLTKEGEYFGRDRWVRELRVD